MLKAHVNPNAFERGVENTFEKVTNAYSRALDAVMEHRPVVIAFALIVFASLPVLFKFIPAELAPSEDKGAYMMMAKAPNTANLDYIEKSMSEITTRLGKDPAMATSLSFAGIPNSNQGMGIAVMKPWSQRPPLKEVMKRTNEQMQDIPEMTVSSFQFPELPGAGGGMPLQYVITTPNNFESLFQVADEMLQKVKANPQFIYSELDLAYDSGTMRITVNRDKAGAYGITMQDIGVTLSTFMSDGYVNRIDLNGRSYEVIPQVERKYRLNPESLKRYYVRAADGTAVPLGNLVNVELVTEPRSLPTFSQLNSATISVVPTPGVTMGEAVNFFEQQITPQLPLGYQHNYMGEARQYVTEGNALIGTFALALFVIFLVLASQFESVRDPLVILVSVPLAICGALIAMAWGLSTMNIYTQVGLITLVGLITKHGILICEVTKEEQLKNGLSKMEAVKHATRIRLRPILMTTAAMIAGLIPLLYATGAGAAQRFSIGIVIVAGLAIGTLFTLFVLPVIYTYLASEHKPLPVFDETIPPKANGGH